MKGDFSINNTKTLSYGGFGSYQSIDEESRYTTYSDKSSFVKGKLVPKENAIERQWTVHKGVPLVGVFTQYYTNGWSPSVSLWAAGGYGRGYPDATIMAEVRAEALNEALDRFHTQCSNRQLKLMEYILERAKVKDSIVSAFKTILELRKNLSFKKLFKTMKFYNPRTKKIEFKRVEMSLSEKWLAYNFMWKPLLNDIYTLMDGFKPIQSKPIRVRGYAEKANYEQLKDSFSWQMRNSQYSVRCSVVGSVIIEDPLLAVLDELGLADPSQIVWDAIPFSFVVDWFINIGSILDAASSPGKTLYGTSVTYLSKYTSSSSGHIVSNAPPNGSVSSLGSGISSTFILYKRIPGPLPRLRLELLGGINSGWRLSTAYALTVVLGLFKH